MVFEDLAALSRHDRVRMAVLVAILVIAVVWASAHFLQPGPPRHIVLASGAESGIYNQYALRYKEILGREGVTVDVRMTGGAGENLRLLRDPKAGVEVAFMQGGVATAPEADGLVMLASLYYEPLWIFYRDSAILSNQAAGWQEDRHRHRGQRHTGTGHAVVRRPGHDHGR